MEYRRIKTAAVRGDTRYTVFFMSVTFCLLQFAPQIIYVAVFKRKGYEFCSLTVDDQVSKLKPFG